MDSKVNGIVKRIKEDGIESFYFKVSVHDGYKLKLVKEDSIVDNIYLTSEEAELLLEKLHIKTDAIIHKVFNYDVHKEIEVHKLIYYVHELGAVKEKFSKADATKEDLVNATVHLGRITKDNEIASLDFEGIQQEELFNILHNKHRIYLAKYEDVLLTEVISSGT